MIFYEIVQKPTENQHFWAPGASQNEPRSAQDALKEVLFGRSIRFFEKSDFLRNSTKTNRKSTFLGSWGGLGAVLGRSWGDLGRSWVHLGAVLGGLGAVVGGLWAGLVRF